MQQNKNKDPWTEIISSKTGLLDLRLKEIWRYKDLLALLVKRDYITIYKQTILGPVWFLIQPVLTVLVYIIVFRGIAGISTDGIPPVLFYLAGITLWSYFAECFNKIATVFKDNAAVWGKVYFPRLIVPFSITISGLIKLSIQLLLFFGAWSFFLLQPGTSLQPNMAAFMLPILLIITAAIAMGAGLIFAALTRKYRDLFFVLGFGLQLAMYATPIIYPLSSIGTDYKWLIGLNPMTSVVETFRYGFLGSGSFLPGSLIYSFLFGLLLWVTGVLFFNKAEKTFVDTI